MSFTATDLGGPSIDSTDTACPANTSILGSGVHVASPPSGVAIAISVDESAAIWNTEIFNSLPASARPPPTRSGPPDEPRRMFENRGLAPVLRLRMPNLGRAPLVLACMVSQAEPSSARFLVARMAPAPSRPACHGGGCPGPAHLPGLLAGGPLLASLLGHGPDTIFPSAVRGYAPVGVWTHVANVHYTGQRRPGRPS